MTARGTVAIAGTRAAETLRAEGYDGRVVLVGEAPIGPYERPALSKEFLAGTRDEASLQLRRPSFWDERGVELVLGSRVVELDPIARTARTSRGLELAFDALVRATGARPRRLPLDLPAAAYELRTLVDARLLRERLFPGAGLVVIGIMGVQATIVEAAPAPVARVLGDEVGLLLAERRRAHGSDVRLRTGLARVRAVSSGSADAVLPSDGSALRAGTVLVGVGVEPASELLPERSAATAFDVAAARRILGPPVAAPQPQYVRSDQFGLRLQVVGTPRPEHVLELEGGADSFAARYVESGSTRAALFANRPAETAMLRRAFMAERLPLAA
ncbi:MAG: FAD-dependent oxidoreductase [Gaiellaceae bacterium]